MRTRFTGMTAPKRGSWAYIKKDPRAAGPEKRERVAPLRQSGSYH